MGCDGGTIPRRDELVRIKKKPEKKDKDAEREFRWLHCALTQQRLQEPIVICSLGRLYSKQSVIERLLEKDLPESAMHIKSMKDIKQLKLTENPAYEDIEKKQMGEEAHAPYICKLIGLEMSGKFRFIALWSCGCVMSERALKQIKGNVCALCQTPFSTEDIVILNANEDEYELMLAKRDMRAAKLKNKKSKSKKSVVEETNQTTDTEPSTSKSIAEVNGKEKSTTNSSKIKQICIKRGVNNKDALEDPDIKKLKTDYSVAKDPKASDVYKSLFTTHKSEQEQTRAHWVTYNPFYN